METGTIEPTIVPPPPPTVAGAATPPPPSPPPIPRYPIRTMPPGRAWLWTGAVKKTVIVRSGETVDVALRAEAFARGVFVMKDYTLAWTAAEGGGRRRERENRASAAGVQRPVRRRGEVRRVEIGARRVKE